MTVCRPHRLGQPGPRSVAVFRALQLGDLLCTVPAFRALRAALPQARIVLVGLPWAKSFVERYSHLLDGFLEFPGFPGLPESQPRLEQIPSFFRAAQREQFDLAIQMHGSGRLTNPLTVLLGARINAGFFVPGEYCPDPDRFMPYPDGEHEVHRYLHLLEFLGLPSRGEQLEFPLRDDDWHALHSIDEIADLRPGEYLCVHPGARLPSRRWPPERFAAVADALATGGLQIVLTGSAEEAELTRAVRLAMKARPLDLAGRTSLGALAALLSGARLLVSNDTGIAHVAAALQVPSVIVANGSDPARWAPLDRDRHRVVFHPIDCRPCAHIVCPIGHLCALAVEPGPVVRLAKELLRSGLQPPGLVGHARDLGTDSAPPQSRPARSDAAAAPIAGGVLVPGH